MFELSTLFSCFSITPASANSTVTSMRIDHPRCLGRAGMYATTFTPHHSKRFLDANADEVWAGGVGGAGRDGEGGGGARPRQQIVGGAGEADCGCVEKCEFG